MGICVSVCLSVCLSVTHRCSIETAERIQLVFDTEESLVYPIYSTEIRYLQK